MYALSLIKRDRIVGPPSNRPSNLFPSIDALPQSKDYGRDLFVSWMPIPQLSSFDIQSPPHHGKILVSRSTRSSNP